MIFGPKYILPTPRCDWMSRDVFPFLKKKQLWILMLVCGKVVWRLDHTWGILVQMKITLMVASVVDHKAMGPEILKGIRANEKLMIFNYPINILAENAGLTAVRWQSITTTPTAGRLTIASYARTVTLSFMWDWPCQQGQRPRCKLPLWLWTKGLFFKGLCLTTSDRFFRMNLQLFSTFAMKTFDLIRFAHGTHLQQVMEVALQEFPVVFEHVSGRVTGER